MSEKKSYSDGNVSEEAPANCVGGGSIAGAGVGPQGEPGVNQRKPSVIIGQLLRRRKNTNAG